MTATILGAWLMPPAGIFLVSARKIPKKPTKGYRELPLATPFHLDPPGPSILALIMFRIKFSCSHDTERCPKVYGSLTKYVTKCLSGLPDGMKKLPAEKLGREIFSEKY